MNQCTRIYLIVKFGVRRKMPEFGNKVLYLVFLDWNFKETFSIFEINALELIYL